MAIPVKHVRIGSKKYRIILDPNLTFFGEFEAGRKTITINPDKLPANSMLHELLHLAEEHGGPKLSEDDVLKLEHAIAKIFFHNKKLCHWLVNNCCDVDTV